MGFEYLWLGVVALFVAVAAAVLVRARRAEAARAEAAAARGWRYTRTPRGFRIEGGEDVPWALTLTRPRSTGSGAGGSTRVLWETPAVPTDAVVLIGPKLPAAIAGLDLGGNLVQLALRALLGEDARDLASAHEVQLGSAAFRERFTVFSSSDALAASLLTPEIEAGLLAAPQRRLAVLRWRDRLELRLDEGLWTPEAIEALVALGRVCSRGASGP